MDIRSICKLIDNTLLKPEATQEDIKKLVNETMEFGFWSCCVNQCWIDLVAHKLKGSGIKVCSVIGFPLGTSLLKAEEAAKCVACGADELDMVINVGWLKSGLYKKVEEDIRKVVDASQGRLVKVILETCLLTLEEKVKACQLAVQAGASFVKTSTGFGKSGATIQDVKLMRKVVGPKIGVKASGGIRTLEQVIKFIDAGASRIGTSHGAEIVKQKLR